jgi:DNA-binding CsgD family transcriptional regulator
MSSRILRKFVDGKDKAEESPVDRLTDRELEVYQLIGQGFSTREIADKLYISIKTVENHRAHIKEKLNLKNSLELIQQATLWVQID